MSIVNNLNTSTSMQTGAGALATMPAAFYAKRMQDLVRQKTFIHNKLAEKHPIPKNEGATINFRKIAKLDPKTTALSEGVTPTADTASKTAISATVAQYGAVMYFTDVVDFTEIDPMLAKYNDEQGYQAGETLDLLVRTELNGGSNVVYAGGKSSRVTVGAGDKPTIDDFRKMALDMKTRHVPTFNGKYIAMITPAVEYDLLDDPKFEKAYEIGQKNTPFIEGEIADIYGIKFIVPVNGMVFEGEGAESVNVHSSLLLGKGAYGITDIAGEGTVKSIVKGLGSAGTEDPINQRQSIGWKVNAFVAKRMDEESIIRYESVPSQEASFVSYA